MTYLLFQNYDNSWKHHPGVGRRSFHIFFQHEFQTEQQYGVITDLNLQNISIHVGYLKWNKLLTLRQRWSRDEARLEQRVLGQAAGAGAGHTPGARRQPETRYANIYIAPHGTSHCLKALSCTNLVVKRKYCLSMLFRTKSRHK